MSCLAMNPYNAAGSTAACASDRFPLSEEDLVADARSGHGEAYDELCRRHAQLVFRVTRRITKNREDAEDALQDSFLSGFVHIRDFDGKSHFSTWLTRIGINSALMLLRKKRNSHEVSHAKDSESESPWEVADSAPDPEQQYVEKERAGLVRKAITNLRLSIRRPLELHTLQDYSLEEMAAEIGVSVPAAKGRLHHARAALRKSRVLRNIRDRHWRRQLSKEHTRCGL